MCARSPLGAPHLWQHAESAKPAAWLVACVHTAPAWSMRTMPRSARLSPLLARRVAPQSQSQEEPTEAL
eukprot:3370948-Alexandrium_andersonii.AAC.1